MSEELKYSKVFQNWNVKRLIGAGSYGKVYELERIEGDAVYRSALKVITIPQSDSEIKARLAEGQDQNSVTAYYRGVAQSLMNENRVMAELRGNSNIVSYEDHQVIYHEDGIGCDILIRMELLTSFIDYMASHAITEETVIQLGIDICKALEICERKNIIHRDIKPGNIFVSDAGDFKLGDFGIARTIERTTGGLSKKGTYRYMAPEVYRGDPYGRNVDICSLGLVMYYLANGNRTPFLPAPPAPISYNDEENALIRRMRGEQIPPPRDASPALTSIILKACAYNERARYASAGEMRKDLESLKYGTFRGAVMWDDDLTVAEDITGAATLHSPAAPAHTESPGFAPPGSAGTGRGGAARRKPAHRGTPTPPQPATGGRQPAMRPAGTGRGAASWPQGTGPAGYGNAGAAGFSGTGSMRPAGTMDTMDTATAGGGTAAMNQKTLIIIGASVLAVVLIGMIIVFGIVGKSADRAGTDPTEITGITDTTDAADTGEPASQGIVPVEADVSILDADWDWDSSDKRKHDNFHVDGILWVQNHSDTPITGIDYYAVYDDGSSVIDAETGEELQHADGYIGPRDKGVMISDIMATHYQHHEGRVRGGLLMQPDDDKIRVQEVYTNHGITGYTIPKGKIFEQEGESYHIVMDNPNDVPVNESAVLVAVKIRDDGFRESDATGRLSKSIPANTNGFLQYDAFYDPHFYVNDNEDLKVYAIDRDYYKNATSVQ